MKRLTTVIFICFLMLLIGLQGFAQDRMSRSEIYDQWNNLNLTDTTGNGRLTWLPEGKGYLESEKNSQTGNRVFYKVNPKNKKRSLLFDKNTETNIINEYNTLTGGSESGFPFKTFNYLPENSGIRFKVGADNDFVYMFKTKKMIKLLEPRSETAGWVPHRSSSQLTSGSYSADFKKIAYIKEYDLYVLNSENGKEEQITFGGTDEIMNGRTDWVYPEELRQSEAFWWSPNGKKIAYLQFDVRAEFIYPLLHEIDLEKNDGADHYRFETLLETERYPKAGEANPTVKLFIVDIGTKKSVEIKTDSSPDVYLIKVEWRKNGSELTFQRLNRFQNKLE